MSELPTDWVLTTLGEVAEWGSGGTPRKGRSDFYDGEIPWAVIGDLNDSTVTSTQSSITPLGLRNSSAKLIEPGSLLIAMYGSIGKLGIAGMEMTTNQAIAFCRVSDRIETKYLFWYLMSQRQALGGAGKGATQQNISQTILKSWPIPLPPIGEQRRIVVAIEGHLTRIEAAEKALHSTIRRAAATLRQVRAGLLQGWPTCALTEVAEIVSGNTPKGLLNVAGGSIPFYKVGDMNSSNGTTMATARTWLDDSSLKNLGIRVRPAGTVIFPKRGGAIATNKKRQLASPAAFDLNTMGVIAGERISAAFLLEWFNTIDLGTLSDGSNVPQINNGDIATLRIAVPPLEDQARLVAEIRQSSEAVSQGSAIVASALVRAATLRRSVLAWAFSGLLVPHDTKAASRAVAPRNKVVA